MGSQNHTSNRYPSNPWWYVDPTIVDASFITTFTSRFYGNIKDKDPIKRHHHRYQEPYVPAWKAMEYMTLGNLENLYDKLLSTRDKSLISQKFIELTPNRTQSSSLELPRCEGRRPIGQPTNTGFLFEPPSQEELFAHCLSS